MYSVPHNRGSTWTTDASFHLVTTCSNDLCIIIKNEHLHFCSNTCSAAVPFYLYGPSTRIHLHMLCWRVVAPSSGKSSVHFAFSIIRKVISFACETTAIVREQTNTRCLASEVLFVWKVTPGKYQVKQIRNELFDQLYIGLYNETSLSDMLSVILLDSGNAR